MRLRSLSFPLAVVFVAGVVVGAAPSPVDAAPGDHENKTSFTDEELEEAKAYSNAKWEEWLNSSTDRGRAALEKLRFEGTSKPGSLGNINKVQLNSVASRLPDEKELDRLIRKGPVNVTSVEKTFYAHIDLAQLEANGYPLGGGSTAAIEDFFDTPSRVVTFRHYLDVNLTPRLPEWMDPLETLTVKITVPEGGVVAYLGGGKALLPLNTFMGYDLSSLEPPTASSAYQLCADVHLPRVRSSVVLRDQDSLKLTELGKELKLVPQEAPLDALRIDTTGFRGPVVYMRAKNTLESLSNPVLVPEHEILQQAIAQTFKVNRNKRYRIRFTGETLTLSESMRGGLARGGERVDIVLDARLPFLNFENTGTFVHEIMHVIDFDRDGYPGFAHRLGDVFRANPGELDALLASRDWRLGEYWRSELTPEVLQKLREGKLAAEEEGDVLAEAFAEFGRFRFTGQAEGDAESLADYFRSLAPNTMKHLEESFVSHLARPVTCGVLASLCCSSAKAARVMCEVAEEELVDVHRSNLVSEEAGEGSVLDGVEFVTAPEQLETDVKGVLSPLKESSKVFAEFDVGGGAESLKELAPSLKTSLGKDLRLIGEVSAHAGTVSKALAEAGKAVSKASELLPYVAIAATGYALSEDIRSGNWVDAGFDGVAEALMMVGGVEPALMIFTEPALLVDIAVQWVVDYFRGQNAPAPVMEPWQREHADRDYQTWQDLPKTLSQLRLHVTEEQLVAATEQVMRENIVPALRARLASDEEALTGLRDTYAAEAYVATANAAGGAFAGEKWNIMQPHLDATMKIIDEAFAEQKQQRREAYAVALGEQVQAVSDHFGLKWTAGSVVFNHIRAEFDREVALPTVEASEALMSEYSRYQNPPIAYPVGESVVEFRRGLVESAVARYETEFARVFPNPLTVTRPSDMAENLRLLAGEDQEDPVTHSSAWGAAVPGGMTEEISIHDPRNIFTGVMTVTAPDGARIVSVRTNLETQPPISMNAKTATIGSEENQFPFGGGGAAVLVKLLTVTTEPGKTLNGSFAIDEDKVRVSAGKLDVVVRDTIPAGHGFAAPGAVTEEVVIYDPRVSVSGVMMLTAPAGTTFEAVTNNIGATNTISADKKTATVSATSFGAQSATVRAKFRVPANATQNKVFAGGRVAVTDGSGVVQASGALTVSTHPVTFSQRTTPSLPVGGTGDAVVRVQNHTSTNSSGITFAFTAPTNTVFTTGSVGWKNSTNAGGTSQGTLSADGRTITYTSDSFQVNANAWVDLTVKLKATSSGTGTITDGAFAITGGRILPTGGSTPLAYTAVITSIPRASGEAGPGKTVELKIYDPNTKVTGTMTLDAPTGTTFTAVTNNIGATVTYSTDRKKATISRTSFGGAAATVWAKITLPATAAPTATYTGAVTVTDNNTPIATGTLDVYTTIDGCLTAIEHTIPISLVVWIFPVELRNNCYAKIDARVIFSGGIDSGWQTVPAKTDSYYPGSETYWSTPYARYDHYQTGNITRP